MLQLRVFGDTAAMTEVAGRLRALEGARHVSQLGAGDGTGQALVTADLGADAADPALALLRRLKVPSQDVALLRLESIQPDRRREAANLVWADLLGQAGEHARPVARYLVFMAVAGVIAGYGVLYANAILIVGAMAVSPDLLPITSIAVGLVAGRRRLVARGSWALVVGLGLAGLVAAALTFGLDVVGLLPSTFEVGESVLSGITTANSSTFLVAFAAGVAGMLALESRASAAVGVAISVTTIPASAYLGVASGLGEVDKAAGALLVLVINLVMLVVGATGTLLVQRAVGRRADLRSERA